MKKCIMNVFDSRFHHAKYNGASKEDLRKFVKFDPSCMLYKRRGVFVAFLDIVNCIPVVKIGWAFKHPRDKHDSKEAVKVAIDRAITADDAFKMIYVHNSKKIPSWARVPFKKFVSSSISTLYGKLAENEYYVDYHNGLDELLETKSTL